MTFIKKGDVVRRKMGTHTYPQVVPGKIYTVAEVEKKSNMIALEGVGGWWHIDKFEAPGAARTTPPDDHNIVDVMKASIPGRKDDSGKLDMTLLDDMPRALSAIVEVMQWAITKKAPVPYVRGSWLGVHADRYRAALLRHNVAATKAAGDNASGLRDTVRAGSEARFQPDDETKLLHLAHIACSAMMALENTLREMEKK